MSASGYKENNDDNELHREMHIVREILFKPSEKWQLKEESRNNCENKIICLGLPMEAHIVALKGGLS